MMSTRPPFLLLAFAAASAACSGPRYWVEASESIEVASAAVDRFRCETHNGHVHARLDDGAGSIAVVAKIRAGGADELDAEAALAAIEVRCGVEDGRLDLGWQWREPDSVPDDWGAAVSFDLVVPRPVAAEVVTHNGGVELVGVGGDCSVETHNGGVVVEGDVGTLRARTHNGSIRIAGPIRSLTARTHNGGIRAALAAGGQIDGRIVTHNGSIDLELADGADVELRCATHNGSIRSDHALHAVVRADDRLIGRLGEGSGRLEVETHNGRIRVGRAEVRAGKSTQ